MLSILFLIAWMATGTVLAVAMAEPDEPPGAWVPYGLILGPLWAAVALDRRPNRSADVPADHQPQKADVVGDVRSDRVQKPVLAGVGAGS